MKHTLVVIGYIGDMHAYLDLSFEEAKRRYQKETEQEVNEYMTAEVFEFDDMFGVYDAWAKEKP